MCTMIVEKVNLDGSGKGAGGCSNSKSETYGKVGKADATDTLPPSRDATLS